jgi:molecular chaperone Hsp33
MKKPISANDNSTAADISLPFMLEKSGIRGRIVRLHNSADKILSQHTYPFHVSAALGDLLTLASLIGSTLKIEGILSLQAQGDGPINYMVAEYSNNSNLRAYASLRDINRLKKWEKTPALPRSIEELFGKGFLAISIDGRMYKEQYQGIVELSGLSLAENICKYFKQSEQLETEFFLSTLKPDTKKSAAGVMIQRLPQQKSETENSPADEWENAAVLLASLTDAELLDPQLPSEDIIFRLYHQETIRIFPATILSARCRCNREKMLNVIISLSPNDRESLYNEENLIDVECQFCGKHENFYRQDCEK